ncbi:MAG: tartrate dehydrogenase [Rhodospirillales bacterium]|nr:tartrate dehydrogenase [Rhodospirillales bacterium]
MAKHKIALIPGDGIGKEVLPEGVRVLEAAGRRFGFELEFTDFDWSCDRFAKTGKMMPDDGMETLKQYESIFLGAVGWPGVPDHVSLWGLLIPIRREFDEYVNLRPVRLFEGVPSPLANRKPGEIDFWVVRENTEGEYSSVGGRMFQGTDDEMAIQQAIFTRKGVDRVLKYAFEFASTTKKKHVTSATKSNGIIHTMPFWDERFDAMRKKYPNIKADQYHIDILTAHFVRNPAERKFPSMFEPVHGSAPDIAGRGIANPIGQIWSGAMMVRHLGYPEAAEAIERAIAASLVEGGPRTKDLGGNGDTKTVGASIAELVKTA